MTFSVSSKPLSAQNADLLLLPVFEGEPVSSDIQGLVEKRMKREGFTGKKNTTLLVQTQTEVQNIVLIGMGKDEPNAEDILAFGAIGARKTKAIRGESLAVCIPNGWAVEHIVTGILLGNYSFTKHKNKTLEQSTHIKNVTLLTSADVKENIAYGETIASAVMFARDLVNQSPSQTTPSYLAAIAMDLAKNNKDISCTVLPREEMEKMGGLMGIARGSSQEPKFIHLTYKGGEKVVTLAGKGITFDSGGLSIKSAQGMETMKLDMAGAAVVLAVFSVLPKLKPKITVHGLIPATENMPGPGAVKPGDVVTAMNGKTIEILNTDAEGRVILADALSYAGKHIQSDVIIDFATLTGACMIALGEDVAGLFSNNKDLAAALLKSAKHTGEKVWELPLIEEYKDKLQSHVADIKNIGGKYGGAITGALFIQEFVPQGTPWAHLDIAGPSFTEKDTPLCPHGATGFGIRMILDYLSNR
jgi:leucyl aminopeptidase